MTLDPLQAFSTAITGLVAKAAPAVVSVRGHRSAASGFVWRPGLVVTADEALADEGDIAVTLPGGEIVGGTLVGRDPSTDVALIRIERLDVAPVAFGVVSRSAGAWRSLRGGSIDARLELAVSLRRRSEGGVVLDAAGAVLGMAVFGPHRRVLVIPSQTIERVAAALQAHGRVARGYLGLSLQRIAVAGSGAPGAIVIGVDPQGPAALVGIRQGDVFTMWNGEPLRQVFSLARSLGPDSVGKTVTLGVLRAGEAREFTLVIGERPAV